MNATEAAAWIGALTGTIALFWDFVKWSRTGARIQASVSPNMVAYGSFKAMTGDKPMIVINATNVGGSKTTITHAVSLYYDSWFSQAIRRKPSQVFIVPQANITKLPKVLDSGEQWTGMIEQDEEIVQLSNRGRLFCGVYYSTSKKPAFERLIIHGHEDMESKEANSK